MIDESILAAMMQRVLSTVPDPNGKGAGSVGVFDVQGVRFLHFGTPWIQGAMRIDEPFAIEIEYLQQMMMWMLFVQRPAHIVQLGLGAASLSKFCWRQFPQSRVTAVELDPTVIEICHEFFGLPADDQRLSVLAMDAMDFVRDPARHGTVDVLQVDIYDAAAQGPVWGTLEFYRACADCLTPDGIMTINLFCDHPQHQRHLSTIADVFHGVAHLPEVHDGNIVAIAFKKSPLIDFSILTRRAHRIDSQYGLPAESWVAGLLDYSHHQQDNHHNDDEA